MKKQTTETNIGDIMARIQIGFDSAEPEASLDQTNPTFNRFTINRYMESIVDDIPMIRLSELVSHAISAKSYVPALIINAKPDFYYMEIRNLQNEESVMDVVSILSLGDINAEEVCIEVLDRVLSIEIGVKNNGLFGKDDLAKAKSSLELGDKRIMKLIKDYINNGLSDKSFYYLYSYCKRLNDDAFTEFFLEGWIQAIGYKSVNSIFVLDEYKNKFPDNLLMLEMLEDYVLSLYTTITDEAVKLPQMQEYLIEMHNAKLLSRKIDFLRDNVLEKVKTATKQELINSIDLIDILEDSNDIKTTVFESYMKAFFALDPNFEKITQMENKLIPRRNRSFSNYELFGYAADKQVSAILSEVNDIEVAKTIYQKIKKDDCYSKSKIVARKQIFKLTTI